MARLSPGDPVGRFTLLVPLGEGSMATVFLGRAGAELVAVKVMKDHWIADPDYRARFRREIRAARSVNGMYTAAPLDFDADASAPWLATRYLPGLSLHQAVALHGAGLPAGTLRSLAVGVAEALAAVHEARVVHRDLKPDNVLLTADGPRVIDFGISRPEDATFLTLPGESPWARSYWAPERIAGEPGSRPSDVYALGAVLLFAAAGAHPFGPDGGPDTAPDLSAVADPELRAVLADCLLPTPADRPTARQLVDRIGAGTATLSGTGWLPDRVAAAIADRVADAKTWPSQPADQLWRRVPAAVHGAPTLPPPSAGAPHLRAAGPTAARLPTPTPPSRVRRRAVLVAAGVLGPAAVAGTATGLLWPRDRRTAPPVAGRSASPSSTATPRAAQRWRVRVADGTYPEVDVAGGVVLAWSDTALRALDAATGRQRWRRTATLGGAGVAFADGSGALRGGVTGGLAYFLDNSGSPWTLWALSPATGAVRWRRELPGYPTPKPVAAGSLLCFGTPDGVRAVSASGGQDRWSASLDAGRGLAAGGGVLAAVGDTAVTALSADTGARTWRYALAKAGGPLVAAGLVLLTDEQGAVHALRASDGRPAWRRTLGAAGTLRYADGTVFAATRAGVTYALRAATGATVWSFRHAVAETYGHVDALAPTGGAVYVAGTDRTVYALDAGTGRPRWTFPAQAGLTTPPAGTAALVYVGTGDGYVRALVPPNGGSRGGA
ncbi:outer membrane protein assembly factor BamB family protein [Actinocatenispora rupis]|uniref:Protein kinase domain-containing protein n=1 Tax=Actinocatenispora rupis TaxID=519421 RepID=A0A8J3J9G9_9ACTN|nr:PQQ-binding-like beta-propeller repeat protein [Actinocatenispora rupis]GID12549.1 hypothetical protein Aru02nite_34380 [Actinocatenispora rupis]